MAVSAEQLFLGNVSNMTDADRISMRLAARRIKHKK